MTRRDRRALKLGILLSVVAAGVTAASVYAAGIVFLFFSMLLPLIVSLMAGNKVITLSLMTNLLLALICLVVFFIVVAFSPSLISHYGIAEVALGIVSLMLMAVIPALIVSGLVKLIRRKKQSA